MFSNLPPFQPSDSLLISLSESMLDGNLATDNSPSNTPAGVTYLGQFLDHDLTLDSTLLSDASINVESVINGRTPRLDLDSMYGGGLNESPELYDSFGRFKFSAPNGFPDFQRASNGRALLPESRNDENLIIAQIHLLFQKVHNRFMDYGYSFAEARKLTCWHYQWLIVHEFLPAIVGQDAVNFYLTYNDSGKPKVNYAFYVPGNPNRPMMPVEFSVAAYRFGHSMVRNGYFMATGSVTRTSVFNLSGNDLRGSRPIPANLKMDFANFFELDGVPAPAGFNVSRKMDSLISSALFNLPIGPVVASESPTVTSLAARNLLRGKRMGLPSYQDVAGAMGLTPYTNAQLGLTDPEWGGKAPLWWGILKESELSENGARLGPVGRHIVAEVILGLIDKDRTSYFNSRLPWYPAGGTVSMSDLLQFVDEL